MLKDKQFWNEIEDILNGEHNEYVVLDVFFTMKTYLVLTDENLSELPVLESKYYNVYHSLLDKVIHVLGYDYWEYESELYRIAKDVPEVGVTLSVLKVIAFVRKHMEPLVLFCAMGVLTGIEDYANDASSLCVLRVARNALFNVIVSL